MILSCRNTILLFICHYFNSSHQIDRQSEWIAYVWKERYRNIKDNCSLHWSRSHEWKFWTDDTCVTIAKNNKFLSCWEKEFDFGLIFFSWYMSDQVIFFFFHADVSLILFVELVGVVDELKPVNGLTNAHRPGLETWTCAWSEDNLYFAWSCGDKFVRLVPWDKPNGRL